MQFVLGPFLQTPGLTVPERLEVGTLMKLDAAEIETREHGGPVHKWNHRLTFAPIGENRCLYTDEIETDDGLSGFVTRLFIRVMFRHRHHRWRLLTEILAA
jgi:hypothetical protein